MLSSPCTGKQIFGTLIPLPANSSEWEIFAEWLVHGETPQNITLRDKDDYEIMKSVTYKWKSKLKIMDLG